jgi:acyl dehydratase
VTDYRNRTFAEIAVGETVSTSRAVTATDVEALALASGDVEPLHIADVDGASTERTVVQGAASVCGRGEQIDGNGRQPFP